MKDNTANKASEMHERVRENVSKLPVMSVGLAFLMGVGTAALMAMGGSSRRTHARRDRQ